MTEIEKHQNLVNNVQELINFLEKNNIKCLWTQCLDGVNYTTTERNWSINKEAPDSTFLGLICNRDNIRAYDFLKRNGKIDIGICWDCGLSPIKNDYTFSTNYGVTYFICRSCNEKGLARQKFLGKPNNPNCYIATVCYGDMNSTEVREFREFRDKFLYNNLLGRIFIRFYYFLSPELSVFISKRGKLNKFIRLYILNKLLNIIRSLKKTDE
jgi:hypothetical protein